MKVRSLHLLFLLLSQVCLGASEEKVTVILPGGEALKLTARNVDPNKERKFNPAAEYTVFEGKLYNSQYTVPEIILLSGSITIEGKKVDLDVSGLAEPWVVGKREDKLEKRFVHLDDRRANRGLFTLTVVFAKGGALDYLVEWEIFNGKSLRTSIANCGDTYPKWVKPAEGK